MPQPIPSTSFASLCSFFTSHLAVSIHTILSARAIYPSNTFLTAKAYNLPVKQSRHPGVCNWINDAVAAVETELLKGLVNRVVLVIFSAPTSSHSGSAEQTETSSGGTDDETGHKAAPNQDGQDVENPKSTSSAPRTKPLERYIWDVSRLPSIPLSEINTPFRRETDPSLVAEHSDDASNHLRTDKTLSKQSALEKAHIDMQEQFRGLLSRLCMVSGDLKPLPKGCTYSLCIELKDEADPPIGHPQPWIPSEKGLQRSIRHGHEANSENADSENQEEFHRRVDEGVELGGVKTTPVRAVDAGEMLFEMWIEEGQAKFD